VWVRYLTTRQRVWSGRLAEAIPVHSKFWREQSAIAGELLYVAVGDSTAQGIGASRPNHSYVGLLARHIRSRIPGTLRVANLAVSGSTVGQAVTTQLPKLAKLDPDILTVCIGANDIASFDERRFEADARALFSSVPTHAIVADLPSFYFLPGEKKVVVANRIVRSLASEFGLTVVSLHARTRRQGLLGIARQFAGDLFHPNDRGYRVWAAAFEDAVDARIAELTRGD